MSRQVKATFRVQGMQAEWWNPFSGVVSPAASQAGRGRQVKESSVIGHQSLDLENFTGTINHQSAAHNQEEDGITVSLDLEPYGSRVFYAPESCASAGPKRGCSSASR
jgi:hypothetical protein